MKTDQDLMRQEWMKWMKTKEEHEKRIQGLENTVGRQEDLKLIKETTAKNLANSEKNFREETRRLSRKVSSSNQLIALSMLVLISCCVGCFLIVRQTLRRHRDQLKREQNAMRAVNENRLGVQTSMRMTFEKLEGNQKTQGDQIKMLHYEIQDLASRAVSCSLLVGFQSIIQSSELWRERSPRDNIEPFQNAFAALSDSYQSTLSTWKKYYDEANALIADVDGLLQILGRNTFSQSRVAYLDTFRRAIRERSDRLKESRPPSPQETWNRLISNHKISLARLAEEVKRLGRELDTLAGRIIAKEIAEPIVGDVFATVRSLLHDKNGLIEAFELECPKSLKTCKDRIASCTATAEEIAKSIYSYIERELQTFLLWTFEDGKTLDGRAHSTSVFDEVSRIYEKHFHLIPLPVRYGEYLDTSVHKCVGTISGSTAMSGKAHISAVKKWGFREAGSRRIKSFTEVLLDGSS